LAGLPSDEILNTLAHAWADAAPADAVYREGSAWKTLADLGDKAHAVLGLDSAKADRSHATAKSEAIGSGAPSSKP
jgi:hypothetical protein